MSEAKKREIVTTVSTSSKSGVEAAQIIALVEGRRVTRHVRKDKEGNWRDLEGNSYA